MPTIIHKNLAMSQSVAFYLLWILSALFVLQGIASASVCGKNGRAKPLTINLLVSLLLAGIFHIMLVFVSPSVFIGRYTVTLSGGANSQELGCIAQQSLLAGIEHLIMFGLIGVIRDVHNDVQSVLSHDRDQSNPSSKQAPGKTWVTVLLLVSPWVGYAIIAGLCGMIYGFSGQNNMVGSLDSYGADGGLPYCLHRQYGDNFAISNWIIQVVNSPLYAAAAVMIVLVIRKFTQARTRGVLSAAEGSWLRWFCFTTVAFIVVMILRALAMSIPGLLRSAPTLLFAIAASALAMCVGWGKQSVKLV